MFSFACSTGHRLVSITNMNYGVCGICDNFIFLGIEAKKYQEKYGLPNYPNRIGIPSTPKVLKSEDVFVTRKFDLDD